MAGEAISIRSEFLERKDRSLRFRHVMVRASDGAVAAENVMTGVHMGTGVRKAIALDDDIRERISSAIS